MDPRMPEINASRKSAQKSLPHRRAFLLQSGFSTLSCQSAQGHANENHQHAEKNQSALAGHDQIGMLGDQRREGAHRG